MKIEAEFYGCGSRKNKFPGAVVKNFGASLIGFVLKNGLPEIPFP
jgi:hypothetical protein